jgi:uncharacterized protein
MEYPRRALVMTRSLRLLAGLLAQALIALTVCAQSGEHPAAGFWTGSLRIPGGVELRVGVTISGDADDALSAAVRIIDQNTGDIACDRVSYQDGLVMVGISRLTLEIEGTLDSEAGIINAEFRQRGGRFPLELARVDALPELNRPQEPKRPFPYREEEVEFVNEAAGVRLAATLTLPEGEGPFPAVLLLTGSGAQNRDEEYLGHRPFLVLADHLTRHGIAVLRADDRGVGGSTGDFQQSSTGDFADDALAGVAYLKGRREIDPQKVGLIGHSEGGMTAPIAATRSGDVAFIVMMAGPGVGLGEAVIFQISEVMRSQGASDEDVALQAAWRRSLYSLFRQNLEPAAIEAEMRRLHAALSESDKQRLNWPEGRLEFEIQRSLGPWWHFALSYDAAETLGRVTCPVLAINGEKDMQNVSRENMEGIERALRSGGHADFVVRELPGLNHMFQAAETGSEYEYGRIEETLAPVALELITDWILERTR